MSDTNKALANRFHIDIFQAGKLEVADEILSSDFVWNNPGNPPEWRNGPEGTKVAARTMRGGMPDLCRSRTTTSLPKEIKW